MKLRGVKPGVRGPEDRLSLAVLASSVYPGPKRSDLDILKCNFSLSTYPVSGCVLCLDGAEYTLPNTGIT